MARKYVSDIIRSVKDASDHAVFLEKLAEALDNDQKLSEAVKKATDTMMPAGVIRGGATTLREYSKFMQSAVDGVSIEWPPKPAESER